jgi:hypothetical protein
MSIVVTKAFGKLEQIETNPNDEHDENRSATYGIVVDFQACDLEKRREQDNDQ